MSYDNQNNCYVLPDGSGFFIAEVPGKGDLQYWIDKIIKGLAGIFGKKCSSCNKRGAIMYNRYNRVVQCHRCGAITK